MGNPTKAVGGNIIFAHYERTFLNLSEDSETTASVVIPATPTDRTVLQVSGFTGDLWEDGAGGGRPRQLALRQVNDTNIGLWCGDETGSVEAITLRFMMMTFPASSILHLTHYVASVTGLADTGQDWATADIILTEAITDFTKAGIFSGVLGSLNFPMITGNVIGNGELSLDPLDGSNAKLRYQSQSTPGTARASFSVLELK